MTEPVSFSLLNIDASKRLEFAINQSEFDKSLSFVFDVSNEVNIEKRQVRSLINLFGELGGLYEVLATASLLFLCLVKSDKLSLDMMEKLFHVNLDQASKSKAPGNLFEREKLFKPLKLKLPKRYKLVYFWTCCFCFMSKRDQKLRKLERKGEGRIKKALDTKYLIE